MRYCKGSVVFNVHKDLPILRRVLDSRFITHSQLYEFTRFSAGEFKRQVFNWRVRRFSRHGLIHCRTVPFLATESIYSITSDGVLALENQGELPFAAWINTDRRTSETQIPHCLELNNIELALLKGDRYFRWTPESQIRCLHAYVPGSYAKVYDAVI